MVDSMYVDWKAKGASILMLPTDLDFGRSFVAADPDGHRLRVYTVDDE
jgi:predicted enzyme related to lactoylglutathione lyase